MTHRLAAAIIEQRSLLAALPAEAGHEALHSELKRSLGLAEAHNQKHEMLEGWQTVYVVREAAVFLCGDEELAATRSRFESRPATTSRTGAFAPWRPSWATRRARPPCRPRRGWSTITSRACT